MLGDQKGHFDSLVNVLELGEAEAAEILAIVDAPSLSYGLLGLCQHPGGLLADGLGRSGSIHRPCGRPAL